MQAMSSSKPIRVLLIAPALSILGGQAVQAARLLRALKQAPSIQIEFQQIAPHFPSPLRLFQKVKFVRTGIGITLYTLQLLKCAWRYDILHVFTASNTSYMFWSLPALATAKLYRKRIILHYHDGRAEDHLRNWRTAIPTIRMMDAVVAPSDFLVDVFAKFGLKIRSISNILDMEPFRFRARSRLRPVFLHNRSLEPLYNIRCSMRAFKRVQDVYPDATLTLAHDGPSRPELEAFAREIGLRNTKFIGKVPHEKIGELYDSADIYFTSPDIDCMPGSILECFAAGLPVVATKTGGIPYIAEHGVTALLVDRDDDDGMANSALRLLADPALVERLTRAAYESCARYAEGPVRAKWVALYHELLGRTETGNGDAALARTPTHESSIKR
jgi:glycosyltransferase involved in cell wall biosynthesis